MGEAQPAGQPAAQPAPPQLTERRPRRPAPRWLAPRRPAPRWVVAVPVLALAACLAFELAAAVAVVVEDPLAPYADNGFRVVVQWPRLVAFAAFLLLDVVVLVVGAVRIARHPAGPAEEDGRQPARVADWAVRVTAAFPVVALAYLVAWAALEGSNPTGVPYQTAALERAVGVVAVAIAVLSFVVLLPALGLLRRGPFRTGWPAAAGAVALAVVTAGVPFAATWLDPPGGAPVGSLSPPPGRAADHRRRRHVAVVGPVARPVAVYPVAVHSAARVPGQRLGVPIAPDLRPVVGRRGDVGPVSTLRPAGRVRRLFLLALYPPGGAARHTITARALDRRWAPVATGAVRPRQRQARK